MSGTTIDQSPLGTDYRSVSGSISTAGSLFDSNEDLINNSNNNETGGFNKATLKVTSRANIIKVTSPKQEARLLSPKSVHSTPRIENSSPIESNDFVPTMVVTSHSSPFSTAPLPKIKCEARRSWPASPSSGAASPIFMTPTSSNADVPRENGDFQTNFSGSPTLPSLPPFSTLMSMPSDDIDPEKKHNPLETPGNEILVAPPSTAPSFSNAFSDLFLYSHDDPKDEEEHFFSDEKEQGGCTDSLNFLPPLTPPATPPQPTSASRTPLTSEKDKESSRVLFVPKRNLGTSSSKSVTPMNTGAAASPVSTESAKVPKKCFLVFHGDELFASPGTTGRDARRNVRRFLGNDVDSGGTKSASDREDEAYFDKVA